MIHRNKFLVGVCLAMCSLLVNACTASFPARVPSQSQRGIQFHTADTLRQTGRDYEVVGLLHAEKWAPSMYWTADSSRLQTLISGEFVRQAQALGADAVVNLDAKVENHYQLAAIILFVPLIFNHEEAHVGAIAIKYK